MPRSPRQFLWHRCVVPLVAWGTRLRRARYVPLDAGHLSLAYGYDEEEAIKRAVKVVRRHTMTSFERLATLWQQVRYLDRHGIAGALVECGTWRGGSAGMMALSHQAHGRASRRLHLFDSFGGLREPDPAIDGPTAVREARRHAEDRPGAGMREQCAQLLEQRIGYPRDLLDYHQGWFEQTVPDAARSIGEIALLRLDGDWYASTRVCLEHLYPRLVKGGVLVVDDYGHYQGCRRAVDEFIAQEKAPILLCHIDYAGRYWVKQG